MLCRMGQVPINRGGRSALLRPVILQTGVLVLFKYTYIELKSFQKSVPPLKSFWHKFNYHQEVATKITQRLYITLELFYSLVILLMWLRYQGDNVMNYMAIENCQPAELNHKRKGVVLCLS